jgi:hypothetical protein
MRSRIGANGARCNANAHTTASLARGHEAVAFALLHRPHAAMGGYEIVRRTIQACEGGGHLIRLGLP